MGVRIIIFVRMGPGHRLGRIRILLKSREPITVVRMVKIVRMAVNMRILGSWMSLLQSRCGISEKIDISRQAVRAVVIAHGSVR